MQRSVPRVFTVRYISQELQGATWGPGSGCQSGASNGAHQHSRPRSRVHYFDIIFFVCERAEARRGAGGRRRRRAPSRAEETCYLITQAEWTSAGGKGMEREDEPSVTGPRALFFFFFSEKAHFEAFNV